MSCPIDCVPEPFEKGYRQSDGDPLFPSSCERRAYTDSAIDAIVMRGFDSRLHENLMVMSERDIFHAVIVPGFN
jgi:hypothetical protein